MFQNQKEECKEALQSMWGHKFDVDEIFENSESKLSVCVKTKMMAE
jgi:hypothetical protein